MTEIENNIEILKSSKNIVPFKSIEYLQNHEDTYKITDEIIKALKESESNNFLLKSNNEIYDCTPLWFLIVAEKHINIRLVISLAELCGKHNLEWDLLNEQINFLVSQSCLVLKDEATKIFFDQIYHSVLIESNSSYLFLIESFFFLNKKTHLSKLIELLHTPECYWYNAIVHYSGETGFMELHPELKKIAKNAQTYHDYNLEMAANEASEILLKNDQKLYRTYANSRKNWDIFYRNINSNLDQLITKDEILLEKIDYLKSDKITYSKKIGRNEKCPCGSGIKYKKCCLVNLN